MTFFNVGSRIINQQLDFWDFPEINGECDSINVDCPQSQLI